MEVGPEAAVVQPDQPALAAGAMAELFAERYEPMVRLAYLLTGSNEVAEDLVHDATPAALDADEMLDAVAQLPYPQRAALVMSHLRRGLAALRLVVEP